MGFSHGHLRLRGRQRVVNIPCYEDWREDRFDDMLAFRDLHGEGAGDRDPLHLLPTCIGCGKRWACAEARGTLDEVK